MHPGLDESRNTRSVWSRLGLLWTECRCRQARIYTCSDADIGVGGINPYSAWVCAPCRTSSYRDVRSGAPTHKLPASPTVLLPSRRPRPRPAQSQPSRKPPGPVATVWSGCRVSRCPLLVQPRTHRFGRTEGMSGGRAIKGIKFL